MKTNPSQTRKIFPLLMIILLILAAIAPAFAAKEERKVSRFTELEVSSAFKVILTQGNTEKLLIDASEDDMDQIITEVKGSKLIIRLKSSVFNRQIAGITIYLTFNTLTDIDISGAVEVKGTNVMSFNDLEIEASGASTVTLNLSAKKLSCDLSGASSANLVGQAARFDLDLSGSSKLDAREFTARESNIDASGASSAQVNVTEKLKVEGSGASNVRYSGNPAIVVSDLSGASSVKKIK